MFWNFEHMRVAKREMEIMLWFYWKNLIQVDFVILAQKWYILITLDLLSGFLLILHNKNGKELHCYQLYIYLLGFFLRKNLIWNNLIVLGHFLWFDCVWSKFSQGTVTIRYFKQADMISFMITTGSLNSKDMVKILQQQLNDFLVNVYVMDIVWILCYFDLCRSIFNRGLYGFRKKLL